jgi:transposase
VFAAADEAGVAYQDVKGLDVDAVKRRLFGQAPARVDARVSPDFATVHEELGRPGVTLVMLWGEYVAACRGEGRAPFRYSSFCDHYRRWAADKKVSLRIPREPGRTVEVDWAGDPMVFADPGSGVERKAYLFVTAWPYSAYVSMTTE